MRKLIMLSLLAACGDTELAGSITATAYGEAFIEEGIPADAFGDGWAVQFDKFLISIGEPRASAGGTVVGDDRMYVVDLAQPSGGDGYELATFEAPAGDPDHYGYRIAPSSDAIAINATPADAEALISSGYSIWLQGRATKDGVTKTLDWGFALKLGLGHCDAGARIDGDAAIMQATIHADHFFYDDAVSDEPGVAFQLIADSDANDDGAITLAELAARDIRGETRYQVGSKRDASGAAITNLGQYLELQATTLGHLNGEGHCDDLIVEP